MEGSKLTEEQWQVAGKMWEEILGHIITAFELYVADEDVLNEKTCRLYDEVVRDIPAPLNRIS